MLRTLAASIVILFVFTGNALSQNDFLFEFDYSVFQDETGKNIIEFYYSFNPENLLFTATDRGFEANGKLDLEVINKEFEKTVVLKSFKVPVVLKDTSGIAKNFKLTGQINMLLDSGLYEFRINASDFSDENRNFTATELVSLNSFPDAVVSMSTIQLGTAIVKSNDTENIFYKNTLEVTPNPSGLFGNNISTLFYYLEVYNLSVSQLGEKYKVTASIADKDGTDLKTTSKIYDVKTDSKVEFGSFDVSGLPSNRYLFQVKLFDAKEQEIIRAFKYFYVFSSDTASTLHNLSDIENEYLISEYPKMKEETVVDEFNKAIYIMSDIQKNQFEGLISVDEKRMYMFKFWKLINSIISKKEYFARIDFANKNFKSDFREGWKTDRGRVYAIYGKYDDIDRFPYEGSTRAYEVWTYNKLQGGVVFVFIDMSSGFGDYVMVHSTAQNELRDDNWQEKLRIR
jgi:GWxTD domain-containing protein